MRIVFGAQLMDRKGAKDLILMLGLKETMN